MQTVTLKTHCPNIRLLIGLLLVCCSVKLAYADEPDTLVTLKNAVAHALGDGLTVRIATNNFATSSLQQFSAKQALLPTARSALSTNRELPFADAKGSYSVAASVGAAYELVPSRFLQYTASKKSSSAAQSEFDQEKSDIAAEVIVLYVQAVSAEAMIQVQRENLEYQKQRRTEIEAFVTQGIKARSDVLLQLSTIAQAEVNLLKVIQTSEAAKLTLLDRLGLPLVDRYRIDTTAVTKLSAQFSDDTTLHPGVAIRETAKIRAQRLRIESARLQLASCKAGYIPTLSVSTGYSVQEHSGGATAGSTFPASIDIGASLGIPLFDQKQRFLKVKNGELALEAELLALERLLRAEALSVRQAELADSMGMKLFASSGVQEASALEILGATEERYRLGLSTVNELAAVQAGYAAARSALLQAQGDAVVNRINLLNASGCIEGIIGTVVNERDKER